MDRESVCILMVENMTGNGGMTNARAEVFTYMPTAANMMVNGGMINVMDTV